MTMMDPLIVFTYKPQHKFSSFLCVCLLMIITFIEVQSNLCRTSCGNIPINYPLGIDDGCGSPYYRHILDCSELDYVIVEPKPIFCERFPDRCDSSCDSASYLCRHLPECSTALDRSSCCSYYPKATESLRLMLKYCASYTSVYWRTIGTSTTADSPTSQVPEYRIRVDFDIPVTTHCLQCQDPSKGAGTCGFDTQTQNFLCLCKKGNVTSYCKDLEISEHRKASVIAGAVMGVSAAGAVGIGVGIWFFKKVRAKAPLTCGVQSNENRLF
ncbi:hypothetical protein ERO13_D10G011300v2 [Gossypium hirsutum]|nr:hypothetical protein ERO13_D10G011300v2 [Gossypium hirsutum]